MARIDEKRKQRLEQAIRDMGNYGVKLRKPEELPDFDQPFDYEEEKRRFEPVDKVEEQNDKESNKDFSQPSYQETALSPTERATSTEEFHQRMGKTKVIAETGAGQHGVATATAAALMGMECVVYMGKEDTERQALNVYRMRLLGATVIPVTTGTGTLKDACSACFREWTNRISDTHYCLGSVMGPHPFPTIVRDFQAVISKEIKEQMLEKEGRLPDAVLACVGGGSNAIGAFYNFIEDKDVQLIGCEAAGRGVNTAETAATIATGRLGIFHGMKSYFCQDEYGQIAPVYSISAGLDYPGIGPEHANLYDTGRAQYVAITDDEAVDAFEYLSRIEGIIPAIESAHAIAYAMKLAPTMGKDKIIVVNVSGRGDKDCAAIARYRGEDIHE